jgi:hypothetical protein
MSEIIYVDGVERADYLRSDDGPETMYPDAFHLLITIPADRRDDVDRNDATRRELTAIIEAALAAYED